MHIVHQLCLRTNYYPLLGQAKASTASAERLGKISHRATVLCRHSSAAESKMCPIVQVITAVSSAMATCIVCVIRTRGVAHLRLTPIGLRVVKTVSSSGSAGNQGVSTTPYNYKQLNGTSGWFGGLDISDVQQKYVLSPFKLHCSRNVADSWLPHSAVNTWIASGYQNTLTNDGISPTTFQDVIELGDGAFDSAYGVVRIPICSQADFSATWEADPWNNNNSTVWPCPEQGTATSAPWPAQ